MINVKRSQEVVHLDSDTVSVLRVLKKHCYYYYNNCYYLIIPPLSEQMLANGNSELCRKIQEKKKRGRGSSMALETFRVFFI
jgi:hypothetical protein